MIRIKRAGHPKILEFPPNQSDLYNQKGVRKKLWDMQHEKCCYCEKHIPLAPESHVEHYFPKLGQKNQDIKNIWCNLLLACSNCNIKKGSKFPRNPDGFPFLLNPADSDPDPEDHLEFVVDDEDELFGSLLERGGSPRGRKTIDCVGLANSSHLRERRRVYKEFHSRYLDILIADKGDNDTNKEQAVLRFEQSLGANSEYAAFARDFARAKKLYQKFGVRIPKGANLGG